MKPGTRGSKSGQYPAIPVALIAASVVPWYAELSRDDFRLARLAAQLPVRARHLDRALVRFGAARREEEAIDVRIGQPRQPLGELDRPQVRAPGVRPRRTPASRAARARRRPARGGHDRARRSTGRPGRRCTPSRRRPPASPRGRGPTHGRTAEPRDRAADESARRDRGRAGQASSAASIVIVAFSTFDTGHPALALLAAVWNFAASAPGTVALTSGERR